MDLRECDETDCKEDEAKVVSAGRVLLQEGKEERTLVRTSDACCGTGDHVHAHVRDDACCGTDDHVHAHVRDDTCCGADDHVHAHVRDDACSCGHDHHGYKAEVTSANGRSTGHSLSHDSSWGVPEFFAHQTDGCIAISGSWEVNSSFGQLEDSVQSFLEQINNAVSVQGGLVGHAKALINRSEMTKISVIDEYTTRTTVASPTVHIQVAVMCFNVTEKEALSCVVDAYESCF